MNTTLEAFETDWLQQWLVERGIEIISEASRLRREASEREARELLAMEDKTITGEVVQKGEESENGKANHGSPSLPISAERLIWRQ